jgi:hypothetical protein
VTAPVQTTIVPRGSYTGTPLCRPRGGGHFYQCPICGGWVDATDPHEVIAHEGETTLVQAGSLTSAAKAS